MNPREIAEAKAKALFMNLREQYIEGDRRPELREIIAAGEGAFVAANLARFDSEPQPTVQPVDVVEARCLGREREIVTLASLLS